MAVVLLLLLALVVTGVSFKRRPAFDSYLSVTQTQSIKGLFVITVFFSHFCSYVHLTEWYDVPVQEYCQILGQLMVVPFLFYSGYGIYESVRIKGAGYIKTFPKKRILKTLFHFDCAVLLFWVLDLVIDKPVSVLQFLLSLVAWDSIGNSNWFIFAIICAYVFSYVSLVITKANREKSLVLIVILSILYIFVLRYFKDGYWYDTILAFPLGCSLSLFKTQFESLFAKKGLSFVALMVCLSVIIFPKMLGIPAYLPLKEVVVFFFALGIVLVSLHVSINGKILGWFGTQVFGVYILQRIPMNFLAFINLNQTNVYIFFILSFVSTIVLAVLFKKATDYFDKYFLD